MLRCVQQWRQKFRGVSKCPDADYRKGRCLFFALGLMGRELCGFRLERLFIYITPVSHLSLCTTVEEANKYNEKIATRYEDSSYGGVDIWLILGACTSLCVTSFNS